MNEQQMKLMMAMMGGQGQQMQGQNPMLASMRPGMPMQMFGMGAQMPRQTMRTA